MSGLMPFSARIVGRTAGASRKGAQAACAGNASLKTPVTFLAYQIEFESQRSSLTAPLHIVI